MWRAGVRTETATWQSATLLDSRSSFSSSISRRHRVQFHRPHRLLSSPRRHGQTPAATATCNDETKLCQQHGLQRQNRHPLHDACSVNSKTTKANANSNSTSNATHTINPHRAAGPTETSHHHPCSLRRQSATLERPGCHLIPPSSHHGNFAPGRLTLCPTRLVEYPIVHPRFLLSCPLKTKN